MSATVLSDEILNALLARPDHQMVPCVQFLKPVQAKPCNCSRDYDSLKKRQVEGEHARICIFQLSQDRLRALKELLKAESLVLYMNTPGFPRRAVI